MRTELLSIVLGLSALAPTVAGVESEEAAALAAAAQAIRQADLDLGRAVATDDVELFRSLIAPDAVFFGAAQSIGPDQVTERWTPLLTPGGPSLQWTPEHATVFPGGTLGFTTGRYVYKGTDKEGKPIEARGNYLTVWRKGPDGKWRATVDIGT